MRCVAGFGSICVVQVRIWFCMLLWIRICAILLRYVAYDFDFWVMCGVCA